MPPRCSGTARDLEIIEGGTCPPCTIRDFMKYLIYVEHSAENLQFFLWYRDYEKRFRDAKTADLALAPEWTQMMENDALMRIKKEHVEKVRRPSKDAAVVFKGQSFERVAELGSDTSGFVVHAFAAMGINSPSTYLVDDAPRQLNISDQEQKAALQALSFTTHPSALRQIANITEATLRQEAHPNFIRWSICNGNPARVAFGPEAFLTGVIQCVVLHGLHHRHIRPWELFTSDVDNQKDEDDKSAIVSAVKNSFDSFESGNNYEEAPWVVKYEKRNIVRKVFDREVWIEEPALRQVQDTIFVQSMLMPNDIYQADPPQRPPPEEVREPAQRQQPHNGSAPLPTTTPTFTNGHRRTPTDTAEIDETLSHPGSVRINVKGAFIVDSDTATPTTPDGRSGSPGRHETKDIRLPNHTAVVSHIAVDIGGSLAKLVYFSREAHSTEPGGRLNFLSFETDRIDECLECMRQLKDKHLELNGGSNGSRAVNNDLCVMATGGGAYKFYDKIRDVLGVDVLREDEMECLIIGLDFFITEIPREVFTYSETDPMHFVEPTENVYPYLLVNIGSGVSFLKVSGPRKYERVGGTSLGGGTLWGLLSLLTGARTFDEMLELASQGDNSKVDMLVGDIYGTDYGKIGLKSTTIASSFGKVFRKKRQAEQEAEDSGGQRHKDHHHTHSSPSSPVSHPDNDPFHNDPFSHEEHPDGPAGHDENRPFSAADISVALLYAISNNIGQIAFLQSQIHGLSHIYFGGSFIRGHPQTMNTLSYAIKFWSKGAKQAYFLRHEGYLGAVGAFLKRQPRNWGRRGSFEEITAVRAAMGELRLRMGRGRGEWDWERRGGSMS
ncbi:hypothetical protein N0V88_003736 [Collariella sp. IMI 366227]|nr:hypothetical protein N0V88_003736 [Collariella sp. IMI 366227]